MREIEGLLGLTEAAPGEPVNYPDLLIYAGQSARRRNFLVDMFPNKPIEERKCGYFWESPVNSFTLL